MKRLILPAALLSLAACSSSGDEIVFDTRLGPQTEMQIQSLPNTLEGDKNNARYLQTEKKGDGMESSDGTDK